MQFVVFIGAVIGALFLLASFVGAKGAPQEAAMAAMASAFAVIPYVIFRVGQLTEAENERRKFQKELLERLDAFERRRES